jgi:hypothetical protein
MVAVKRQGCQGLKLVQLGWKEAQVVVRQVERF